MKKTGWSWVLVFALIFAVIIFPHQGHAMTEVEKINKELDKLKVQKAEADRTVVSAKKKITQIQGQKSDVKKDIGNLQNQIDDTGNKLQALTDKIDSVSLQLEQTGKDLQDAMDRVAKRDTLLKAKIKLLYTNGFVTYAEVLLSSTSFADFLDRYQSLTSIVSQDKDILAANKKDQGVVEDKKKQVEGQLTEVKDLYAQTSDMKTSLMSKEKQKEVLIASLSQQEEQLAEISVEQDQLLVKLASDVAKLQEKKKKLLFTYGGGKFGWPLDGQFNFTSGFGNRIDPITGKAGTFHNGVDIGAPQGTSVLAAESGSVIVAGWYGGFGNAVVINHGSGMWTLYGHMMTGSLRVSVGDTVKRGQKIGQVGTTGRSTGPHLHFGVYKDGVAINGMPYLKR